jgi:hypothetical protein
MAPVTVPANLRTTATSAFPRGGAVLHLDRRNTSSDLRGIKFMLVMPGLTKSLKRR